MGRRTSSLVGVAVAAAVLLSGATSAPAAERKDNQGREFWLTFPSNYDQQGSKTLFLTGRTATTGRVEVPGLSFARDFTITPGQVSSVQLPTGVELAGSGNVVDRGVHVTAADEVTAYGLSRQQYTTDAYLGLPTDALGTRYRVLAWSTDPWYFPAELAVVATATTSVVITPPEGSPTSITLNRGEAYQLQAQQLDGTLIEANEKIAVFGGHMCANVPDIRTHACDHVVEQLPPTEAWGKEFLTVPLATRTRPDTYRILADEDGTEVSIDGAPAVTLNAGQVHQPSIGERSRIVATKPVLVAQYSNGTNWDGVVSDPFMMLIPPFEQFQDGYTVTTPASGFRTNVINIVAPQADVGAVAVDGTPVPAGRFAPIPGSSYAGAQVPVELGTHNLTGPQPFGAFVYGFDEFDSYGYPGGLSMAPIARVTRLALVPADATHAVGTEGCVEATVFDQDDTPVPDVRVDFVSAGANATSSAVNAGTDGKARACYTGNAAGEDTITASVGSVRATARKVWVAKSATRLTAYPTVLDVQGLKIALNPSAKLEALAPERPLAGRSITFSVAGKPLCTATTTAAGLAKCSGTRPLTDNVLALKRYDAVWAGDATAEPARAQGTLVRAGSLQVP